MDQNQQYLIEVLARKVTLELLNPLQNRILNLQQDYTNIDSAISKHTQAISIINQQQQQRQLQDSMYLKNINELHATINSLEEKQTLAIQTQNQTFTNLMDRIEHYSQQLNERSEKLKELQQQYQQLKGDQAFVHQTYITNIDNIQKRVNQLIVSSREETDGNRFSVEKMDSRIQDMTEKLNKTLEKADQYQSTFQQQKELSQQVQEMIEQFELFKEQAILKEDHEKSVKQQNDQIKSELNTIQFKYQQILSQNNRNITQMQQQIDSFQYQREDTQRQFQTCQGLIRDVRVEVEAKNSEVLKSINNLKSQFEQRYEDWSETFHIVQKAVEQFKFDFASMKQNYKKNLMKYDEIFEQYKEKCDNDIMSMLNRNTNIQKQYLDEQIQIMDTHFMEELQSLQNQLVPNIIQNITSLDNEGKQNQLNQKHSKQDVDDSQMKQHKLQVPQNIVHNNPQRKSKVLKDTTETESPLGINITSVYVSANKSIRSNSRVDGQIEYQSYQKKQSVSKVTDNLELIEVKQQIEKVLESQKTCQVQYQQLDKDFKQLNDKVKKQHERLEFFFLQTKTQLNKYNSKIDTIQNDTKQGLPPDKEFVDLNYIKREIELLQGQITKMKSDIQNDATFAQQQIKNLQKIRDQILPKQLEQQTKMDQLEECQKLMIILLLQNELVQISHEDGLYRVDQNLNNLHFEFQPGLRDENTHITFRQQRISKVDFILNQILPIKKICLSTSRIDQSLNLSQSQTLRKQQTNRNLNKNSKTNNSVIVGKNSKLNESTRLTMRNTMTVEMSQKYMNRSQRQKDTFNQARISLSNQRLNYTLNDETI
ncbi:unnamed protein product [Paramecium octaurelia]|uniref:Uncharacterized protein n=1 Tax=Paramecium octaurelia TaxID=43137 RepID=A0A8S1UNY2_PAROT|nr:unnamed protein product [Paramecium octaurelia]